METRNITLTLPAEDVRRARIVAAHRGTSVSALIRDMLKELIERESAYNVAKERQIAAMRQGYDLGTGGHIDHARDELHDR